MQSKSFGDLLLLASGVLWLSDKIVYIQRIEDPGIHQQLRSGQWVLFTRRLLEQPLQRGAVVQYISPFDPRQVYTRRVAGVAGDWITEEHNEEERRIMVPQGRLYVVADDDRELDSRKHGVIPEGLVQGVAKVVLFNPNGFK